MVYIIGTDHGAQARDLETQLTVAQQAFVNCLHRTIEKVQPSFIAEEDSEEALVMRSRVSIAMQIADSEKIKHIFCDPNLEERKVIGCEDCKTLECKVSIQEDARETTLTKAFARDIARNFPIRERFWLEKMDGNLMLNGIFICGDLHTDSFVSLLKNKGIQCTVEERGVGVEKPDVMYILAKKYLSDHPEFKKECLL